MINQASDALKRGSPSAPRPSKLSADCGFGISALRPSFVIAGILLFGQLGTELAAEEMGYDRSHWSFQPRAVPLVPTFVDPAERTWLRNEIDAFILDRLKRSHLQPAPEADR